MDKHSLGVVIALLLVSAVAAQRATLPGRYLRESASSSGTDSSMDSAVTVGDPTLDFSSRGASLGSSSRQNVDASEATPTPLPSTGIGDSPSPPTFAPAQDTISSEAIGSTFSRSSSPQSSSPFNSGSTISSVTTPAFVDVPPFTSTSSPENIAVDIPPNQETNVAYEIRSSLSTAAEIIVRSSAEPTSVQTAAPVPVYTFASSSIASSSPSPISSNTATSQSTTSPTPSQDDDITSYQSTGAVSTTEERAAVESTNLELSSSPQQIEDAATSSTSTVSATTPSENSNAPTSDEKGTSTSDRSQTKDQADQDQDQNDDDGSSAANPPMSYSALHSPILYACVVLAVAGLVGAVFAFRAKRKCDVRDERGAVADDPAATPPMPRHAVWAPPISQVRVVIDDRNFAML